MMRFAVSATMMAACFGAPADNQGTLVPDSDPEALKQLLSIDSFNVTRGDDDQNHMHAICDMEYRLSKAFPFEASGSPVTMTNLAAAATPQLPFNPFTAPLAAVTAHIELLKKQKEFLEAQSAAFGGSSTTASADAVKITAVTRTASSTDYTAVTSSYAVGNAYEVKFTLNEDIAKDSTFKVAFGAATLFAGSAEFTTLNNPVSFFTNLDGADAAATYSDGTTAATFTYENAAAPSAAGGFVLGSGGATATPATVTTWTTPGSGAAAAGANYNSGAHKIVFTDTACKSVQLTFKTSATLSIPKGNYRMMLFGATQLAGSSAGFLASQNPVTVVMTVGTTTATATSTH